MDIFFQEPDTVPLPPDQIRIRDLGLEPSDDGRRLRVSLQLTPFQKRPNLDLTLQTGAGQVVAQADVIEIMTTAIEFTLHIRQNKPSGDYRLTASLYYAEPPTPEDTSLPERMIVDQARQSFAL